MGGWVGGWVAGLRFKLQNLSVYSNLQAPTVNLQAFTIHASQVSSFKRLALSFTPQGSSSTNNSSSLKPQNQDLRKLHPSPSELRALRLELQASSFELQSSTLLPSPIHCFRFKPHTFSAAALTSRSIGSCRPGGKSPAAPTTPRFPIRRPRRSDCCRRSVSPKGHARRNSST